MNKNIRYWIAINKIDKLGPVGIKRLYEHFGSIEKVWFADARAILGVEGLRRDAINSFIESRGKIEVDKELGKLKDIKVLCWEDAEYPSNLKKIYDPPPVLYIKGDILKTDQKAVAIVGTRRASRYGLEFAKKMAYQLASIGITIVSGLASGIDTAAHKGALEAKGRTIAVFGCGVDYIFPPENKKLAGEIEKQGALISEFPLGTATSKSNFPRRNRIISGLSLGVIVVEGYYDSGAMITAKEALEQGREVFAVPGNVELAQSKGPHWLIKQGAKLVESTEDVLDELKSQIPNYKLQTSYKSKIPIIEKDYSNLSPEEQKIVAVLSLEPKHLDVISAETRLSIPQVSSTLMMLEIKKIVRQLPGKNFVVI